MYTFSEIFDNDYILIKFSLKFERFVNILSVHLPFKYFFSKKFHFKYNNFLVIRASVCLKL